MSRCMQRCYLGQLGLAAKTYRLPSTYRPFCSTGGSGTDFTHIIVGAGAVGLAIANRLNAHSGASTLLIERRDSVGTETSSRNSEVIHAGLYYGKESLKTKLCINGKQMLYALCNKYGIPYRRTGKWIVAQDQESLQSLKRIHDFSKTVEHTPTRFIPAEEASREEPHVRALAGVLESSTTGIFDSHAYMQYLLGVFEDQGGDLALNSTVTAITPLGHAKGSEGWVVTVKDAATGEDTAIKAETIINSAGLGACNINNMILPPERHRRAFHAKGNYFSYSSSQPSTRRLIYPAPERGLAGLGTHLTLDLAGRIRFGPDVEWVGDAIDVSVNASRLPEALAQIRKYLPNVEGGAILPDYAGIRPKLVSEQDVAAGNGFTDFIIRKEPGFQGFINLLGIESPGLTCSLAIGQMVEEMLYQ